MDQLLRGAIDSDHEFLYLVYRTTMRAVVDMTWGWEESWQRTEFENRLVKSEAWVIQREGLPVGALVLEQQPDAYYIHQIGVLPDYQGRGLGTATIRWVFGQATARDLAVTLSVVWTNDRARRLYERLGFEITARQPPFIRMRRSPVPDVR
jgi:ribosomal protein S18 acetylase RimI-like enzyme